MYSFSSPYAYGTATPISTSSENTASEVRDNFSILPVKLRSSKGMTFAYGYLGVEVFPAYKAH